MFDSKLHYLLTFLAPVQQEICVLIFYKHPTEIIYVLFNEVQTKFVVPLMERSILIRMLQTVRAATKGGLQSKLKF